MKAILFGIWLGIAAYPGTAAIFDETWREAQREAVKAYPDLAKAGSPLNTRFVELYRRAVEEKSFIMTQPDWPTILAEQAAAELSGQKYVPIPSPPRTQEKSVASETTDSKFPKIRLKPVAFPVLSAELPDPVAAGPGPQQEPKSGPHKVTLPVQIFPKGFSLAPLSAERKGPNPWVTMGKLLQALKRRDATTIKSLLSKRAETTVTGEDLRTGHQAIRTCTVEMIAEVEGHLVFFWRDRTMAQPPVPMILERDEYRIADAKDLSTENQRLLRDLFWFLMVNPPKALVAKEKGI
jgi:hypothetical protein